MSNNVSYPDARLYKVRASRAELALEVARGRVSIFDAGSDMRGAFLVITVYDFNLRAAYDAALVPDSVYRGDGETA